MKPILLALVILCGWIGAASAQTGLPPIVSGGLDTYKKSSGEAALDVWLKGSPVEGDTKTRGQVVGLLAKIAGLYGKMTGYEPIRTISLSPSVQRVYVVIKYEKGPLYASFDCYKSQDGWIVPTCDFNTKAKDVLPESILGGSGK